ncbi:hypothetical protein COB87_001650 [Candidatus Wolfebacteria bacterium]|nr:hypothetical protein [Candidatus Wolfebacteria bacterium]
MNFFQKNKTTVIAIGIIIAGFLVYTFFFQNGGQEGALSTSRSDPRVVAANQEFITLFSELRRIDLDTSIFDDSYYNSLVDFSRPISVESVGRDNPFASVE